jgi:hypothetical protein
VAGGPGPAEHDVIVVGNLTVDDIVHPHGETTMASPGGNTIHAATGALIWGSRWGRSHGQARTSRSRRSHPLPL